MKNFSFLLFISTFISLLLGVKKCDSWKIYKRCDESWSADKLWENDTYTLCDYNSKGVNFDGLHITLISSWIYKYSDDYNTRNKYCSCGDICTPGFINTCLSLYTKLQSTTKLDNFWKAFELGTYKTNMTLENPDKAINDLEYILFYWVEGDKNLENIKLAYDATAHHIYGFGADGKWDKVDTKKIVRFDGWVPSTNSTIFGRNKRSRNKIEKTLIKYLK